MPKDLPREPPLAMWCSSWPSSIGAANMNTSCTTLSTPVQKKARACVRTIARHTTPCSHRCRMDVSSCIKCKTQRPSPKGNMIYQCLCYSIGKDGMLVHNVGTSTDLKDDTEM